jgi:hypothetical protein
MKTDYKNLSGSQIKSLFLVDSESGLYTSAPSIRTAADVQRLIAEMRPGDDSSSKLLETATHETTPVQELTRIKELAKALMKEAADGRHLEAARLLYHLAVAAAFVHHDAEISGRPMRKQQLLYERFAETWAAQPIGQLFREAATRVARANPIDSE